MSQELDKVAREIADVESQIAEVLQQLNQAATQEDRQYLRKKKELLRRIEVQLRNKELWLLQHAEPATSQVVHRNIQYRIKYPPLTPLHSLFTCEDSPFSSTMIHYHSFLYYLAILSPLEGIPPHHPRVAWM